MYRSPGLQHLCSYAYPYDPICAVDAWFYCGRAWKVDRRNLPLTFKGAAVAQEMKQDQSYSEAELLRLAKAGDEAAMSAIFQGNQAKVYSLCLRMTGNPAEADDLTQDSFLQVFRKLRAFRGESALSTWIYRVAVNTVLMQFRKKKLKSLPLEEPVQGERLAAKREPGKIDEQQWNSVDRITLTRAMEELPQGYRTILLMHEVKGYDHREISGLLGCSIGNSKSQLHRAKARMRDLLSAPISSHGKADSVEAIG